MMDMIERADASLADLLIARARTASDGRLVFDVAAGVIAAIAVAVWHPAHCWLPIACLSVCLASFGAWGIADRELGERGGSATCRVAALLRVARLAAAAIGAVSTIVFLVGMLSVTLGTWIS